LNVGSWPTRSPSCGTKPPRPTTSSGAGTEGEVEIVASDTGLDTLGEDEIFGEMALVDKSVRSATARAKTDCKVVPIDEKQLQFLVQETPFFAIKVMCVMAERLRRATANV
jgi:CRP-like cAMP-binding protein